MIDEQYGCFADEYVGLDLGVHHAFVCPVKNFSVIDVFPYHSKLVAIQLRLLLVQLARSIVVNTLVWIYELFDLGRHEKWRVCCLCKFPQTKEI